MDDKNATPRRSRALPFTQAGVVRAIKAVEAAGRFVLAVKPDGTVIVGNKPVDVDSLVSAQPRKSAEAPTGRRFGDYFKSAVASELNDEWAQEHDKASLSGGASQSEAKTKPQRAYDILTSRRRGGSWGSVVTIDEPELIERYRAAGFTLYEEGELEELIRKTPMGKRETAALGGFFQARGEPVDVKGARGQITSRLVTRGYIEVAEGKHRITPAGEAEWLRLTNKPPADQP